MKNNRLIYLLIAILAIWLLIVSLSFSQNKQHNEPININEYNVSGFSTDFTRIVEENKDGIVSINADGTISTGFVYSQKDDIVYIICSYHGVSSANNINVTFGSTYIQNATLLGYDELADIAVLSIETPYDIRNISMSDSTLLKNGEFIINVGVDTTMDNVGMVQLAMIADKHIVIENTISSSEYDQHSYYLDMVAIDSNLTEGYSGSPSLNMNGECIGMVTMKYDDNIDLLLTANEIKIIADRIINDQQHHKNLFGIKGVYVKDMANYEKTNLNMDIQTINGIYVNRVRDNSICFNAGIRANDVLLKINDIEINDLNDYLNASYTESSFFDFTVLRNGETIHLGIEND